jgi:hypoxanthine phosphoribosyltransferase
MSATVTEESSSMRMRDWFSEEQLKNRVQEIARQITADYQGKEIMLISVLRGSFVFMADLCRAIDLPCTLDFMAVSSYGKGTKSSGQVQITKDLSEDITDRHIIVVEDILDSGNTLSYLLKILENRHPASIRLCTLLDKPDRRVKPVQVHYSGFTIPDAFVVGYGLDYAEKYRNLPYIGILKPRVYGG